MLWYHALNTNGGRIKHENTLLAYSTLLPKNPPIQMLHVATGRMVKTEHIRPFLMWISRWSNLKTMIRSVMRERYVGKRSD